VRAFILGLDGATFDVFEEWVDAGKLPNFRKLFEESTRGHLITTIPPLTPSAWSSFMTGKNPGKHGVLDFYELDEEMNVKVSYRKARKATTIWKYFSMKGYRVISIHVPFTYPPEPVNGIMISGFLTPSLNSSFIYPPEMRDEFIKNFPDYRFAENTRFSERREDQEAFREEIFENMKLRMKVADYMMEKYPWDLFMVTFMGIDHAQHWYWRFYDKDSPYYDPEGAKSLGDTIFKAYSLIDDYLGDLLARLGEDTYFCIMSDHGFGRFYKQVFVNNWLKERGFIKFKRDVRTLVKRSFYEVGLDTKKISELVFKSGLGKLWAKFSSESKASLASGFGITFKDVDWRRTEAYSFGYFGPVFVNLEGRFPFGSVKHEDYEKVREKIIEAMLELEDPERGKKIVNKVWKKEEIYNGPFVDRFPDVVVAMDDFAYTSSTFPFPSKRLFATPFTYKSGEHRMNGVFIFKGPKVKRNYFIERPSIMDIAPTLMQLFKIPIPENMDGRVLREIFE